jgi:hypothetical protein
MATLILTAVGTAVGGPIGGAIGAIVGQSLDQRLFAPKPRQGPRLGDLSVQTSSYGSPLPRIFGTMRVAGTVIWSTDLIETRSTSGGGKGRPKSVGYSYSASFAVALSARPILDLARIWADGKLLRGAAGDFKSATQFRLYHGDEDQMVDPLIASVESVENTPAFRGIAYAMFEDFQLEDFGNRIPSLSFELIADSGTVEVGAIAEALGQGALVADPTEALLGYAASGESVRGAIETLCEVAPLSLVDDGRQLRLTRASSLPIAIGNDEFCGRTEIVRSSSERVPSEVSLAYHEVERDYQVGLQRAFRAQVPAPIVDRLALPAVLSAGQAKGLAESRLADLWTGRLRATVRLDRRRCGLRPGNRLTLPDEPGIWRIARWTLDEAALRLELVRQASATAAGLPVAYPGRPVTQPDLAHGPTVLRLHELPVGTGAETAPLLFVAAAGHSAGWRKAVLTASFDDGASWRTIGGTAEPAVIGTVLAPPSTGEASLFDLRSSMEVELLHDGMWLESRDDDALIGGANLALIGSELLQFGAAQSLGGNRFRLSRLLRGRRGTEWAIDGHLAAEPFLLVDPDTLVRLDAQPWAIDGQVLVLASGVGDVGPATASSPVDGRSLAPPSPMHLGAALLPGGDVEIRWARRSRQGWVWASGADTPLGEEVERYALRRRVRPADRERPRPLYLCGGPAARRRGGPALPDISLADRYQRDLPSHQPHL